MHSGGINRFEWLKAVNRSELLPRAKLVASALAVEFCNHETGQLHPGTEKLADATGQTRDTVKRGIRDLVEAGWLSRSEGRGRGNKTRYTLQSLGKVVSINAAKNGANVHQIKGGPRAPSDEKKGAPVRGKGCTSAPSYIEQSLEQNRDPLAGFRRLTFTGNAFTGPVLVRSDDSAALNPWGHWLREQGYPPLRSFPLYRPAKRGEWVQLPWRLPPETEQLRHEARAFFDEAMQGEAARFAAQ